MQRRRRAARSPPPRSSPRVRRAAARFVRKLRFPCLVAEAVQQQFEDLLRASVDGVELARRRRPASRDAPPGAGSSRRRRCRVNSSRRSCVKNRCCKRGEHPPLDLRPFDHAPVRADRRTRRAVVVAPEFVPRFRREPAAADGALRQLARTGTSAGAPGRCPLAARVSSPPAAPSPPARARRR